MNPHALLAAAFAAALLLGPFGCSKKDDSGPAPAANTGNYASDGRLVSCTATVDRHTNAGTDFLTVELATTPPTAGNEIAQRLNISKLTLYKYLRHRQVVIHAHRKAAAGRAPINFCTKLLTKATFASGTPSPNPGITPHTLTRGVFTDVRP